jgi:hypothetical protein
MVKVIQNPFHVPREWLPQKDEDGRTFFKAHLLEEAYKAIQCGDVVELNDFCYTTVETSIAMGIPHSSITIFVEPKGKAPCEETVRICSHAEGPCPVVINEGEIHLCGDNTVCSCGHGR